LEKAQQLDRVRLQVMMMAASQRFSTRAGFKPIWPIL